MNFPGVIAGDPEMLARIATAGSRRVDGHAPGLSGAPARRVPGGRAWSPTTSAPSSQRPRRSGARACGSSSARDRPARTCRDLIPTVLAHGTDHVALCSDDREPDTLLESGHLNDCVPAGRRGRGERNRRPGPGHAQPGRVPRLHRARRRSGRATRPTSSASTRWLGVPALARSTSAAGWWPATARSCPERCLTARPRTSCGVPCTSQPPPPAGAFGDAVVGGARARTIGIARRVADHLVPRHRPVRPAPSTWPAWLWSSDTGRRAASDWAGCRASASARGALASTVGHDAHNCMVVGARSPSRTGGHGGRSGPAGRDRRGPGRRRRRRARCWPSCPPHRRPHERPPGPRGGRRARAPGRGRPLARDDDRTPRSCT